MSKPSNHRIDELPMDRRIAGEARGISGKAALGALYERREVDPTAPHLKRRLGTRRITNTSPYLLGVTQKANKSTVGVDHDFTTELAVNNKWTVFGTAYVPPTSVTAATFTLLVSFGGARIYLKNYVDSSVVKLQILVYNNAGTPALLDSSAAPGLVLDQVNGSTIRFAVARTAATAIKVNAWVAEGTPSADETTSSGATVFPADAELTLFGTSQAGVSTAKSLPEVVLNNILAYNNDIFVYGEYETYAAATEPATTLTLSGGTALLLWHDTLSLGGNILSYTNNGDTELSAYLRPSAPEPFSSDPAVEPTDIRFGGEGTIEIPFYLDFDEYFWTTTNAAARLTWGFQIRFTTPEVLNADNTIFEFQDLLRLSLVDPDGNGYHLNATYNDGDITSATPHTHSAVIAANTSYDVFVARTSSAFNITVGVTGSSATTATTSTTSSPVVYVYDKTIGIVVGDRVSLEDSEPFGGRIERFALFNDSTPGFGDKTEAVFYYDVESVQGDEVIDQGNRAINAYLGTRGATEPPYYTEGGFAGGSYVAAAGGYLVSNSRPGIGYSGQLRKPLAKDIVVQRRGQRAFMTSNGVNYLVDDRTNSIRPLGIPRPATKVSCSPQGVGAIDGFVRYAYRYATVDGTVGPVFELDPCDATGGVNVFLGASSFGIPDDPVFGLTFGQAEAPKTTAANNVECFIAKDNKLGASNDQLLHAEIQQPGLTLETAFRIPTAAIGNEFESVVSQGVYFPPGADRWLARPAPKEFPHANVNGAEYTIQFTFRYKEKASPASEDKWQTLFAIGPENQHTTHNNSLGTGNSHHYRLPSITVTIQPEAHTGTGNVATYANIGSGAGTRHTHSLVVTRGDEQGNNHYNEELEVWTRDYNFIDDTDYTIFVSRCGSEFGAAPGADLGVIIYNHTIGDDPATNVAAGAEMWPGYSTSAGSALASGDAQATFQTGVSQVREADFWGADYSLNCRDQIMWGCGRYENHHNSDVKTMKRAAANSATFNFAYIKAFLNNTEQSGSPLVVVPGQRMYHARIWKKTFHPNLLLHRALNRYGALEGPLSEELDVDIAFQPDSSEGSVPCGWDRHNDTRVPFLHGSSETDAIGTTGTPTQTVFLAYGFNNTISTGSPNTHITDSTDKIPLWASYSSRDGGSLSVGVGRDTVFALANRRWYDGSGVLTHASFANEVDFREWTWLTLYFEQLERPSVSNKYDVYLQRIFLNGETGAWGNLFHGDASPGGPDGKAANTAAGGSGNVDGQYTLFTVGGVPGIDTAYAVEIAEARLWNGNRYTGPGVSSQSGVAGVTTFGPYMSTRVPPNYHYLLHHYLRFTPLEVDDMETQTSMDQSGLYDGTGAGAQQETEDAVKIYQGAEVTDNSAATSGGSFHFIPFPTPPLSAIRGIQIFRTQIVPVAEEYPNGEPNPNATTDAFKACRAAPLYYLSEIPDGTDFYFDTAIDTLLGAKLDVSEGLIPGNPGGIFEWAGFLGIWVTDIPRIYFAASPTSWESFPSDMVLDLPLREYGTIEAAVELASRDARRSRVLVLGKSWGAFLDGSPTQPQVNTLGGGVGAATSRCLVVEKGIAYAYNGTLWAITGDGAVEDIGIPVMDLLPDPESARLSVSSALGSLYVINESTGLTLRWHFARREWFIEDRAALSTTDIAGEDNWVHLSGFPSKGHATTYADDVESTTLASYTVASFNAGANTITISSSVAGLKVGQRITVVADEDPRERETVTITAINLLVLTVDDLALNPTSANNLAGTTVTLNYKVRAGIGYWGTMLDTGQFANNGVIQHVDLGITAGDRWYAMSVGADFATDPTSRGGFDTPESHPTRIDDGAGTGRSARWGLTARQRVQRLLIWSFEPAAVGLSELELNYSDD